MGQKYGSRLTCYHERFCEFHRFDRNAVVSSGHPVIRLTCSYTIYEALKKHDYNM